MILREMEKGKERLRDDIKGDGNGGRRIRDDIKGDGKGGRREEGMILREMKKREGKKKG